MSWPSWIALKWMWGCVHFFELWFSPDICPGVGLQDHVVALFLIFLRNFHTALPRRRQWHPTPVLLPGKSHGRRSLVGCSPWGCYELGTTERLHFSLSCIGEGNGNPLQCSFLENPRDGEPGGLPSMGLHRVRHDWSDLAAAVAAYCSP